MKNLTLFIAISLVLAFVFINTFENRQDIESYMAKEYTYTSGDILFLATYDEQDILIATDITTEEIKSIQPINKEFTHMINYPGNIIEFRGETNQCYSYSEEKIEVVGCEVIKNTNPIKTEEIKYSEKIERFININKIETKDYIILE